MIHLGPPILAFIIADCISVLELITSKYPRTFFLLKKCPALYIYAVIYGVIGFAVMLGLNYLVSQKAVTLEGLGLSNPWWQAVAIGLSVKAFLHLRIFSVGVGAQTFPIGTETIVLALGASALIGLVSGGIPAWNAARIKIVDGLRRVA